MPRVVGYTAWAFAAGVAVPVMAIQSACLACALGGAVLASLVLFVVGLATIVFVSVGLGLHFPRLYDFAGVPPYLFVDGCIAAGYILSVTSLAPKFGVASTVLIVVCAEVIAAAVIDNRGLLGAPVRPLTNLRMVGRTVALAGVALSQFGAAVIGHVP